MTDYPRRVGRWLYVLAETGQAALDIDLIRSVRSGDCWDHCLIDYDRRSYTMVLRAEHPQADVARLLVEDEAPKPLTADELVEKLAPYVPPSDELYEAAKAAIETPSTTHANSGTDVLERLQRAVDAETKRRAKT